MESKITEYVKCQQEILLHRYNAEHTKIICFLFTYINHILKEHLA